MKHIITLVFLLTTSFSFSQWIQVGQDLSGAASGDWYGQDHDLSADGNTIVIGGVNNDSNGTNSGHVQVFENIGGTWVQVGADILGSNQSDLFGTSVAINHDGSIIAVGMSSNNSSGNNRGHVRIFQNVGGNWTQIGQDINGDNAGENFGIGLDSLDINASGNIVAIGAPNSSINGSDSGLVRVYENNGGTWTQIGTDLMGSTDEEMGSSVDLSDNGNILLVGSPLADSNGTNSGKLQVFENIAGTWMQIGADIPGDASGDFFGERSAINADGSILIGGAKGNDDVANFAGHARIFENVGGTWTQIGSDLDGATSADQFGINVAINGSGNIVAVSGLSGNGHVSVFENTGGTWTLVDMDIIGEANLDFFGWSVSLDASGTHVGSGTQLNNAQTGEVKVYESQTLLSLDDINSANNIVLYPNPASDKLYINNIDNSIAELQIYDLTGKKVLTYNVQEDLISEIDLNAINSGIYIAKLIFDNHQVSNQKILIRH